MKFPIASLATLGLVPLALATPGHAQVPVELLTTAGQQISSQLASPLLQGTLPALRYTGNGELVLQIRPDRPVICAVQGQAGPGQQRVTFDQTGYFAAMPLANTAVVGEERTVLNYGENAFLRGSDAPVFASSGFGVLGDPPQLVFDMDGVSAYCMLTAMVDTPPSSAQCEPGGSDDRVFGGRFEAAGQGSLEVGFRSQVSSPLPNLVSYEYVVRAVGGPVYDVQFREQFPWFNGFGAAPPLFQTSMRLDSNWSCRSSEEGRCDQRGKDIDGAGYVHLEAATLQEGQCLTITAMRSLRQDGSEAKADISGKVHAGIVWRTAPGPTSGSVRSHLVQRHAVIPGGN